MKTYKSIISDTRNTLEIKDLIEVYEELAASKMQKVRHAILLAREFYEKLEILSNDVGTDFEQILKKDLGKKTTAVFISSNSGLYGNIIDSTFKLFLEYINKNQAEIYIIGKTGEELMKTLAPHINFDMLAFPDDTFDQDSVDQVLFKLFPYRKIMVFYGKFYNIAVQHPFMSQISGDILEEEDIDAEEVKKKHMQYFYEPSVFSVSEVFTNQILGSMMEQILRESQLAKFASRLIYLDEAIENIGQELKILDKAKRRVKKKTADKKQNAMVVRITTRGI